MYPFFAHSCNLDWEVLRPLSHILPYWELTWLPDEQKYSEEDGSYAGLLNSLISDLEVANPPMKYHDNEDRLAEYVVKHLKWPIKRVGRRWIGESYDCILEQGGFHDIDEQDLILAAAGRIRAATDRNQLHYDDMEESHRRMLGAVLTIILYHRTPPIGLTNE
jgi:hypothetical protein